MCLPARGRGPHEAGINRRPQATETLHYPLGQLFQSRRMMQCPRVHHCCFEAPTQYGHKPGRQRGGKPSAELVRAGCFANLLSACRSFHPGGVSSLWRDSRLYQGRNFVAGAQSRGRYSTNKSSHPRSRGYMDQSREEISENKNAPGTRSSAN